ncbi:MAG: TonB-dependent receptor [Candidatus Marinimicrobia bacterium]|nr:TonB-dependent receptor [Candidatus Neomarinimicrobiota bacterium]
MKLIKGILLVLIISSFLFAGTAGKITGTVKDAITGEPLAGANVIIDGTAMGAATDGEGYYVIMNVIPGKYSVTASYVGYAKMQKIDVFVEIDLTTETNYKMAPQAFQGETVTVVAKRPVVQKDVSGSQVSVSADEIKKLPASTLGEIVSSKAGVSSSMSIRGGSTNETLVMVDGMTARDGRSNAPITSMPKSAINQISINKGGLSAEYSNVSSGVVNVVTKEGSKNNYSAVLSVKYSPPAKKHFGISPYEKDSYWLRPYTDDDVCWEGTSNGEWDKWTLQQYKGREFQGWNAVSAELMQDSDPTNDLTPLAAQKVFLWQHRKDGYIEDPDYIIDGGFGGPVPLISEKLGNMRFFYSFYKQNTQYIIPLATNGYDNLTNVLKITTDFGAKTKLAVSAMSNTMNATSASRSGGSSIFTSPWGVARTLDRSGFTVPSRVFITDYWSTTQQKTNMITAKLTSQLSNKTFVKFNISRTEVSYTTGPGALRDTTRNFEIVPDYYVNEAPFGFWPEGANGIDGMFMGGTIAVGRDSSNIVTYNSVATIKSQINKNNEITAGLKFNIDVLDMSFGAVGELPGANYWTSFERSPIRLTAHIQDKLEFEGLVANIGLVGEFISANTDWYNVDIYDQGFFSSNFQEAPDSILEKTDPQFYLSPRIGIAHPITETSKLFFNYGHYVQMPTNESLYRLSRMATNRLTYFGNPNLGRSREVSYEIGFDKSFNDQYLIRLSGYYKDAKDRQDWTNYINIAGNVNYYLLTNNGYKDTRGLEIELTKRTGEWLTGNINYEYRVYSYGEFGLYAYNENPMDQQEVIENNNNQAKPLPQPRAKSYITLHTPNNLGPKIMGQNIVGDWYLTLESRWTSGGWFTWNPLREENKRGAVIESNVRWNDYKNLNIKLSKTFSIGNQADVKLFCNIHNLLNIKRFSGESFYDYYDYLDYMYSIHLPKDIGDELEYGNIPGEDRPGTYMKEGVDYVPMIYTRDRNAENVNNIESDAIYYDAIDEGYYKYDNGAWVVEEQSRVDQVIEDRAYINMPNLTSFTFLDPRDIFFGLEVSFDIGKK